MSLPRPSPAATPCPCCHTKYVGGAPCGRLAGRRRPRRRGSVPSGGRARPSGGRACVLARKDRVWARQACRPSILPGLVRWLGPVVRVGRQCRRPAAAVAALPVRHTKYVGWKHGPTLTRDARPARTRAPAPGTGGNPRPHPHLHRREPASLRAMFPHKRPSGSRLLGMRLQRHQSSRSGVRHIRLRIDIHHRPGFDDLRHQPQESCGTPDEDGRQASVLVSRAS